MKSKDASDNNVSETEELEDVDKFCYADLFVEPADEYDNDEAFDEELEEYGDGSRKGHRNRSDRYDPDIMRRIWKPSSRSNSKRW
jgi:hypothetical protein